MKLSNETLAVLKNFAAISEGLYVPGGHTIRVKDSQNRVLAQAEVAENLPSFCVKELARFLSILTADKDVEIEFKGSDIIMTMMAGKSKINYRCSPKNLINVPKDNDYTISDAYARFTLKAADLDNIRKMVSLLGLPNVAIENDENGLLVRAFDPKNDSENVHTLRIEGGKAVDHNFQIILSVEALQFVDGDYEVAINKNAAEFRNSGKKVAYWVAVELGSMFPEDDLATIDVAVGTAIPA
jgi:hypothetical protein